MHKWPQARGRGHLPHGLMHDPSWVSGHGHGPVATYARGPMHACIHMWVSGHGPGPVATYPRGPNRAVINQARLFVTFVAPSWVSGHIPMSIWLYIYILYIHVHIYMYIYMYIYTLLSPSHFLETQMLEP